MSSTTPAPAEGTYAPFVRALEQRILHTVRDDRAALTPDQERAFRDHLRATDARETCPICDTGRFSVALRGGWIARSCARCGHVLLFDPAVLPVEVAPGGGNLRIEYKLEIGDVGADILRRAISTGHVST